MPREAAGFVFGRCSCCSCCSCCWFVSKESACDPFSMHIFARPPQQPESPQRRFGSLSPPRLFRLLSNTCGKHAEPAKVTVLEVSPLPLPPSLPLSPPPFFPLAPFPGFLPLRRLEVKFDVRGCRFRFSDGNTPLPSSPLPGFGLSGDAPGSQARARLHCWTWLGNASTLGRCGAFASPAADRTTGVDLVLLANLRKGGFYRGLGRSTVEVCVCVCVWNERERASGLRRVSFNCIKASIPSRWSKSDE